MKVINHPPWPEEVKDKKNYPGLKNDLNVDIVIIGGGLTGILTAYLLSKSGKKVAVLEKEKIGEGATEYTTAFITQVIDTDIEELVDLFGKKKAKLVWESGGKAIDLIEKIVSDEKIDCDFKRCSAFIYTSFKKNQTEIKNQAKFQPLKFLHTLAQKASENGVLIFEETEVLEVKGDNPVIVKTKNSTVQSQYAVISTYQPLGHPLEFFLKMGLYTSYVLEAKIPKKKLPEAIFWDRMSPYHYFRIDPQKTYDRLIIGGEDHRSELKISPEKNYQALEDYLKSIIPQIKYEITRKWAGPILETVDGLPFIGRMSRNDYHLVATGFSGNGMTYSAIAAQIFQDIILGNSNPWIPVYNPKRIPTPSQLIRKGIDYTKILYGGAIKNFFRGLL